MATQPSRIGVMTRRPQLGLLLLLLPATSLALLVHSTNAVISPCRLQQKSAQRCAVLVSQSQDDNDDNGLFSDGNELYIALAAQFTLIGLIPLVGITLTYLIPVLVLFVLSSAFVTSQDWDLYDSDNDIR